MPMTPRKLELWDPNAEVQGTWWPGDQPNLRYAGTLRIENGSAILTVSSSPVGQEVFALGSATTVHGESEDGLVGKKYTLWGADGTHFHHESATKHSRRVVCTVIGDHLEGYKTARFGWSATSFHDLKMWGRVEELIPAGTVEEEASQHTIGILDDTYADIFGSGYRTEVTLEYPQRIEIDEEFPKGVIRSFPGDDVRVVFHVEPPAPAQFHDLLLRDMQALLTFSYLGGAPVTGQWIGTDPDDLYPLVRPDTFRDRSFSHQGGFQMLLTTEVAGFGQLVTEW